MQWLVQVINVPVNAKREKKCSNFDDACRNSILFLGCHLCQVLAISQDLPGAGRPVRELQHVPSGNQTSFLTEFLVLFPPRFFPSNEGALAATNTTNNTPDRQPLCQNRPNPF